VDASEVGAARLTPYAGDVIRVLGESDGLALGELTVPPRSGGPPPHVPRGPDEAIDVLDGAPATIRAARGVRHPFAHLHDHPARMVGLRSPSSA
jgi:hypothetical protein